MLQLAVKSGIPIIRVTTTDLINFPSILAHLFDGKKVTEWDESSSLRGTSPIYYTLSDLPDLSQNLYDALLQEGKTLILVNQESGLEYTFDAGEVPVPKEMIQDVLEDLVEHDSLEEITACFSGLTLKTISEIIRLTSVQEKSLTPKGIMTMRARVAGKMQGLSNVNTDLPLYVCPKDLEKWVTLNRNYFLDAPDYRLMPRGLLLRGVPGVGKSQAAKYIANQFHVPLYRLDLSGVLGKWVGHSESMMGRVLSLLDQEAPAVWLIDEAEKLFSTQHDDEGVTTRLLSQLLFWMAEHRSQILTVLTCNDMEKLPKELYREGRVDTVIEIKPLDLKNALYLAQKVLLQFVKKPTSAQKKAVEVVIRLNVQKPVPHSRVDQLVRDLVKTSNWAL